MNDFFSSSKKMGLYQLWPQTSIQSSFIHSFYCWQNQVWKKISVLGSTGNELLKLDAFKFSTLIHVILQTRRWELPNFVNFQTFSTSFNENTSGGNTIFERFKHLLALCEGRTWKVLDKIFMLKMIEVFWWGVRGSCAAVKLQSDTRQCNEDWSLLSSPHWAAWRM